MSVPSKRALSEQMKDRDARATMEKIAGMYEAMAKIAATREAKTKSERA